jgi:hypothetical protein
LRKVEVRFDETHRKVVLVEVRFGSFFENQGSVPNQDEPEEEGRPNNYVVSIRTNQKKRVVPMTNVELPL